MNNPTTYDFEVEEHRIRALDSIERASFVTRTYIHVLLAIVAFVGIEIALFQTGVVERITALAAGRWYLFLMGFMVAGWMATGLAHRARSLPLQLAALYGYVLLEAILFAPILLVVSYRDPSLLTSAAGVTLVAFFALTAVAFVTRKDFSFLRSVLMWAGVCSLVAIGAALIFGFQLGVLFSVAMVAVAGASILYNTSNIIHHYPEDKAVAAALELFASVALLFWYILRLFSSRD
ncbi:MAG: Bax inhibitor-1 family protein [Planctomycetota bacterium]